MKEIGCGTIAVIILVGLLIFVPLGAWGARVIFSDQIGRGNAEIELNSADSRIPRYEQFYEWCVSVQNAEASINAETHRLESTTDPKAQDRIRQNISALESTRAQGINQYNADSAKYYTDARFKGYNLPDRLDTKPYEAGGPITQCAG